MREVRIPDNYEGDEPSVFLAGGASGRNWRRDVIQRLAGADWIVLNPLTPQGWNRRPNALATRTRWEIEHLKSATVRLFWFPKDQPCMLSLFELGSWASRPDPLVVGVHPEYARHAELRAQLAALRPDVRIAGSLQESIDQLNDLGLLADPLFPTPSPSAPSSKGAPP